MEFDRAMTVAVKIFVATFFLFLLSVIFLIPLLTYLILRIDINLIIATIFGFVFALFGVAVTTYFFLKEAEKISKETEGYVDTRRYDKQIRDLRRIIDEISKVLPKETLARIEDIQTQCPECGEKVPKGFKVCPHCGFRLSSLN